MRGLAKSSKITVRIRVDLEGKEIRAERQMEIMLEQEFRNRPFSAVSVKRVDAGQVVQEVSQSDALATNRALVGF